MPLTVYQIPFTFTLSGLRLIAASTPHEAADIAAKDMSLEEGNLLESGAFWDPTGAKIADLQCTPSFGPAVPFEGDAESEGFEPEDLMTEAELDSHQAHESGADPTMPEPR